MRPSIVLSFVLFLSATESLLGAGPGGCPGFLKAVFTGSACDTTSDVFTSAASWVAVPEEMYASDLAQKTTVAFGAYMYMEEGVQYDFKGCYDDFVTVKIGSIWVLSKGDECQERTGSFTPTATDWYKIDLRVANNGGDGGVRTSSQYGILWKTSTESTWRKFTGDYNRFMSGPFPASVKFDKSYPVVFSAKMRESDPTVMDVEYIVFSKHDTVDVRALAFQDGVRSFANVLRPETFLDGSVIGDGVAANTMNKFSWRVSADWKIDLANVSIEVLAKPAGTGVVPLKLVTIPAAGEFGDVMVSTNILGNADYLKGLFWYYADGAADLTLKDGWLRDSQSRILVKGAALQGDGYAAEYIYGKMGYDAMGTNCKWPHALVAAVSRIRNVEMPYNEYANRSYRYNTNHRYAIKGFTAPATKTMGKGLYMVINLNGHSFDMPVTYLDAAPKNGWSDEYKTNKLVLRRIDASDGTPYYAGVFEVTEAQWYKVMGGTATTSTKPKNCVSWNSIRGDASVYDWPTVTGVDQNSFMGALRLMTGLQTFDLPNETEWEYAARAGVTTKYLCGDTETGLDDYAWYLANSDSSTHEVGTRQANAWGLHDVHGNVWEWCLNRWSSGYSYRVVRGGASDRGASYCAFTCRDYGDPDYDYSSSGFRLYCRSGSN